MPIHRCYDIRFEQWELDGWGTELLRRKALVEGARRMEDIPVEEAAYQWQCSDYCPLYLKSCPGGGRRLPGFPHVQFIEMIDTSAA